jgi:hypothetical protein
VEVAAEFEVAALGVVGADLALVLVEIEADAVRPVSGGMRRRIAWVPREMNVEADQLVRDALGPAARSRAARRESGGPSP